MVGRGGVEGGEELKRKIIHQNNWIEFLRVTTLGTTPFCFVIVFRRLHQSLIKYSAHFGETDLGNTSLGDMAAADILEALRARKTGRVSSVCVPLPVHIHSFLNAVLFTSVQFSSDTIYLQRASDPTG